MRDRSPHKKGTPPSGCFSHLPLRFIVASRRLNYLHNIISKDDNELIKRVFEAQKQQTTKGDWIELIKGDFQLIEEQFNEDNIKAMSKNKFKRYIKEKIRKAAFKYLTRLQSSHSKIKHIKYESLKIQPYILSKNLTDNEVNNLFALRSRMIRVKENFKNQYLQNLKCQFQCEKVESQQHLLECESLIEKLNDDKYDLTEVEYSDIFGNVKEQENIIHIYDKILTLRDELLSNDI